MFRSLRLSIVLVSLGALGLATLPVLPLTETASAELRPVEMENTGTLLGENSPELRAPPEAARPTGGGGAAGTMTLTVPKLDLQDVAVPAGSTQAERYREGVILLEVAWAPSPEGSNTCIVGHALGSIRASVPSVLAELDKMEPGDGITA